MPVRVVVPEQTGDNRMCRLKKSKQHHSGSARVYQNAIYIYILWYVEMLG